MLEIQNVDIINSNNIIKKKSKKKQILLYDTKRRYNEFILKLLHRRNGKYTDIPHFIITKTGIIYNIFDIKYSSATFNDDNDKFIIKIALENLGRLNKNTINGSFNNWINDPYHEEPYIKNWKDYYYWDKYTDIQIKSTISLIKKICEETSIPFVFYDTRSYSKEINKFNGVVFKSNYNDIYNDINPSFDLKKINIDNE